MIEEAAGVLKYRKRRERAERRLEATEGNLLRLNDLLREVRRGLAPLQKQADAARRHDGLVDELRAIRLHLVGHELAGLQAKTERLRDQGDRARRATKRSSRPGCASSTSRCSTPSARSPTRATATSPTRWCGSSRCASGPAGLQALLAEKRRGLERELAAAADEGVVETLVADAGALRAELAAVERDAAELDERAARGRGRRRAGRPGRARRRRGRAGRGRAASGASARTTPVAGRPGPRRSRRRSTPCAPRSTSRCSPASTGSPAAWSTTSRSRPAPRPRSRRRSATRCTRSSSTATTPPARRSSGSPAATRRRCCWCSTRATPRSPPARRSRPTARRRSRPACARRCPGCRRRSPGCSPASCSPTATGAPRSTSRSTTPTSP